MATKLALKIYRDGMRVGSLREAVQLAGLYKFNVFIMPVFSNNEVETIINIETRDALMKNASSLFRESWVREIYVLPNTHTL